MDNPAIEFTDLESQKPTNTENPPPKNYSSTDNNDNVADIASEPTTKKKRNPQQQDTTKKGLCGTSLIYDEMYVRRFWEGRLKVAELILMFIAMVILPDVIDHFFIR